MFQYPLILAKILLVIFICHLVVKSNLEELPQTMAQETQDTVTLQSEAITELSAALTTLTQTVSKLTKEEADLAPAQAELEAALAQAQSAQAKAQAAIDLVNVKAAAAKPKHQAQSVSHTTSNDKTTSITTDKA